MSDLPRPPNPSRAESASGSWFLVAAAGVIVVLFALVAWAIAVDDVSEVPPGRVLCGYDVQGHDSPVPVLCDRPLVRSS